MACLGTIMWLVLWADYMLQLTLRIKGVIA